MRNAGRVFFWVFFLGYLVLIAWQALNLPERVPGHMDGLGNVDRWGTRGEHIATGLLLALLLLLVGPAMGRLLRVVPRELTNVPHPEYWKSDAHWPEAVRKTADEMMSFAAILAAFMTAAMAQAGEAALGRPWPAWGFWACLAVFLALNVAWTVRFTRLFRLPSDAGSGPVGRPR